MLTLLYDIVVSPLVYIVDLAFSLLLRQLGDPGIALIGVSLTVNFLCLPLYRMADRLQEEERERQMRMAERVAQIKRAFKGDEQYMILSTYYRQMHYKPLYALRSSFSLLLQIPIFMAAYNYLSTCQALQGVPFLFLRDLGAPDALIPIGAGAINLMPILMTLINAGSTYIYTRDLGLRDKVQAYGLALVFLVLLYQSPSGLVFYWTCNQIFSLVKNVFLKLLRDPDRVFALLVQVALVFAAGFLIGSGTVCDFPSALLLIVVIALVDYPILSSLIGYVPKWSPHPQGGLEPIAPFVAAAVLLALLVGLLIPSALIGSSPQEFASASGFDDIMSFVTHAFCSQAGFFVLWVGIYFYLSEEGGRKAMAYGLGCLASVALVNYFFFAQDLGVISAGLVYENAPRFELGQMLVNLLAVAAAIAAFTALWKRAHFAVTPLLGIMAAGTLVLAVPNVHAVLSREAREGDGTQVVSSSALAEAEARSARSAQASSAAAGALASSAQASSAAAAGSAASAQSALAASDSVTASAAAQEAAGAASETGTEPTEAASAAGASEQGGSDAAGEGAPEEAPAAEAEGQRAAGEGEGAEGSSDEGAPAEAEPHQATTPVPFDEQGKPLPILNLSRSGRNVAVIFLDRACGFLVPYIFNAQPELYRSFDGFTFYPNTISFGAKTVFGSPALYGGYEYTVDQIDARQEEPLVDKHDEALRVMPSLFSGAGFDVTLFDPPLVNYQFNAWDFSLFDDIPGVKAYQTQGAYLSYFVQNMLGGGDSADDAVDYSALMADTARRLRRNLCYYGFFRVLPTFMQPMVYDDGNYLEVRSVPKRAGARAEEQPDAAEAARVAAQAAVRMYAGEPAAGEAASGSQAAVTATASSFAAQTSASASSTYFSSASQGSEDAPSVGAELAQAQLSGMDSLAQGYVGSVAFNTTLCNWYSTLALMPQITQVSDDASDHFMLLQNSTTHEPDFLQMPDFVPSLYVDNAPYFDASAIQANGRTLALDSSWKLRHYLVNVAALKRLGEWFDYLRSQGCWDNTRIIIVADHGEELKLIDELRVDESFDAEAVNSLLMIKDFGAQGFETSQEFMTTGDTPLRALAGIVEDPVNPATGNPLTDDAKRDHPQLVSSSTLWDVREYQTGNVYDTSDGRWYTVHDDIYDRANWQSVE